MRLLALPLDELVMIAVMWCAISGGQHACSAISDAPMVPGRWTEDDFLRRCDVAPHLVDTLLERDTREIRQELEEN